MEVLHFNGSTIEIESSAEHPILNSSYDDEGNMTLNFSSFSGTIKIKRTAFKSRFSTGSVDKSLPSWISSFSSETETIEDGQEDSARKSKREKSHSTPVKTPVSSYSLSDSSKREYNSAQLNVYIEKEKGNVSLERTGHCMISCGGSILIHGGYGRKQVALGDVVVLDPLDASCFQFKCNRALGESLPRLWHSGFYLEASQNMVIFGGKAVLGENIISSSKDIFGIINENEVYFDDTMTYDIRVHMWFPQVVFGKIPSSRCGHSGAILMTHLYVMYGGVKSGKYPYNINVLDTERWHWTSPKADGNPPRARSHLSMNAISDRQLVVFGGYDGTQCFNDVHILKCNDKGSGWEWFSPEIQGQCPQSRMAHASVAFGVNDQACPRYLMIYGGAALSSTDNSSPEFKGEVLSDCWVLDLSNWHWKEVNWNSIARSVELLQESLFHECAIHQPHNDLDENSKGYLGSTLCLWNSQEDLSRKRKWVQEEESFMDSSHQKTSNKRYIVCFGGSSCHGRPCRSCYYVEEDELMLLLQDESIK